MAKKTKFSLDDFQTDRDLDFPDMDFDLPDMKDDRKPSTKAIEGFKSGFKDTLKSNAFVRDVAKRALPDGYGQAMDLADQSASSLRELYNTASKELKPAVNELRRTTGRFLPSTEKFLPKKIQDSLKKFADGVKNETDKKADLREAALQANLASVFQAQAEQQQQRNTENDARSRIREGIDQARHRDTLGQLDAIRLGVVQFANFQTNIGAAYYRKSLELQYRHYFVALDALEEQKKANELTKTQLDDIKKNTGLPDFVKMRGTERWKEVMRNDFIGAMNEGIFGQRRNFIRNLTTNLTKSAKEKIKDVGEGIQQGLFGINMAADMGESMGDMIDKHELGGQMAGSWAANKLGNKLGTKARGHISKIPGVERGNNWLLHRMTNMSADAKEWARSGFRLNEKDGKTKTFLKKLFNDGGMLDLPAGALRDAILMGTGQNTSLQGDNIKTMMEPAPFTRSASKSITEIIPGYLARIYRELQVMRTGDNKIQLTTYDYVKNRFSSTADAKRSAFAAVVDANDKKYTGQDVERFIKTVDPKGRLSEEQRRLLGEFMLKDNLRNGSSTLSRFADRKTYRDMSDKDADAFATLFGDHMVRDQQKGSFQVQFDGDYQRLGRYIGDTGEMIQHLANVGQLDGLIEAGIVDKSGRAIDPDRLRAYYFSQVYEPSEGGGVDGKTRRMRAGRQKLNAPQRPTFVADAPRRQRQERVQLNNPNTGLAEVIEQWSSKKETETVNETLLRIEARLNEGILTVNGGDAPEGGGGRRRWWDMSLGGAARRAGNGAWSQLRRLGRFGKGLGDQAFSTGRSLGGMAMTTVQGVGGMLAGKLGGLKDIYVRGDKGESPRLLAWKLRAGHYRDKATGKIIKKFSDIKGAIEDISNGEPEEILSAEEIKRAFLKNGAVGKLMDLGRFVGGIPGQIKGTLNNILPPMYRAATGALSAGINLLKGHGDGPQDVYVKGQDPSKEDPKLTAQLMRVGGYFLKTGKTPVKKVSDIKGAVEDMDGNVRLTAEDIQKGLIGRDGKPLRTGFGKIFDSLKDKALGVLGVFRNLGQGINNTLGAGWNFIKDFFGGFVGKNGLIFAGSKTIIQRLDDIYHLLDERMPGKKVLGDVDGDGVRDGSIADLRRRRKDKEADGKKGGKSDAASSGGLFAGMKGLFDRLRGKKDEKEEEKSGLPEIGLDVEAGDGKRRRPRKGSRFDKMANKKGWRGVVGKGLRLGGRGLGAVGSAAGWLGRAALGMGGLSLGALGGLASGAASAAGAVGSGALSLGGAALSGLGGLAGSALAGLGAILASPVVLGGLAVGAVGAGAYFMYKSATKNRLSKLEAVRYAQYGFLPGEPENVSLIFGLEDNLKSGLIVDANGPRIDEKKVDINKIVKDFGIDLKSEKDINRWVAWFAKRFKPVFLTHVAALNQIKQGTSLRELDKLNTEEKKRYLGMIKFPEGPYTEMTSPIPTLDTLKAGPKEVQTAIEAAETELAKDSRDDASIKAGETNAQSVARIGAVGAGATAAGAFVGARLKGPKGLNMSGVNDLSKIDDTGVQDNRGVLYVQGSAAPLDNQAGNGRIDALTAIRYKTYGLKEMDANKVRALARLESAVFKDLSFSTSKIAEWKGSVETLLGLVGSAFGVEGVRNNMAQRWGVWFSQRFLPTFLNYCTAVYAATNKTDVRGAAATLKPQARLDVAMSIYSSSTRRDGAAVSVWQVDVSPWSDYELNAEVATTDGNVEGLKRAAKSDVMGEETAFERKASAGNSYDEKSAAGTSNQTQAPKSMWESVFGRSASGSDAGTGVAGFVSRAYNSAKSAIGMSTDGPGLGGGQSVQHPGGGTGGDVNSLPMPKGDGSWAAMKDLILGAAKMVGVDPKLMAVMGAIESGFRATVKAGTSSATGLYQFISGTWKTMLQKYGAKYGIAPNTPPTDARANALMGAEFLKENANALKGVKQNLTDTDLYLAHFLGAGGAKKFLSADPNAIAAQVMPDAAKANTSIFYDNGRPRTFKEVYAEINRRVRNAAKTHKVDFADGSESIQPAGGGATSSAPAASGATKDVSSALMNATAGQTTDYNPTTMPGGKASVPVSDVSPGVPGSSAPPPTATTANNSPAPMPKKPTPQDPAVAAMAAGFDPKAANIAAQQAATQRQQDSSMGVVSDTLTQSLGVQKQMLDALLKIASSISMNGLSRGAANAAQQADAAPQRQPARPMPTAPVSMAKTAF